jgi:hypothetical protein
LPNVFIFHDFAQRDGYYTHPLCRPIYGNNKTKQAMRPFDDKQWNTHQYEKLVEFRRKQGNCLVPQRHQEDMSLGVWVSSQRNSHSKNNLRLDRKRLLEKLGFVWKANTVAARSSSNTDVLGIGLWKKQYEKLVEFNRKTGNCLVPLKYQEDTTLGNWVRTQRHVHTKKQTST